MPDTPRHEPLVSVVIPCYNNELYIGEAIDSVLAQDYGNIEVIVVNDGSGDSSEDVIRSFGSRVRLISQENQGVSNARNTGIEAAQGSFIAFLDADDYWLPNRISTQLEFIKDKEPCVCFSGFHVWEENLDGEFPDPGQFASPKKEKPVCDDSLSGWVFPDILLHTSYWTGTAIISKQAIDAIGDFDPYFVIGQDQDYWVRLSLKYKFVYLKNKLSLYRTNRKSATKKFRKNNYRAIFLENHIKNNSDSVKNKGKEFNKRLSKKISSLWFEHSMSALIFGDRAQARKSAVRSIKYYAINFKMYVVFLVSFVPPLFKLLRYIIKILNSGGSHVQEQS